MTDDLVKRLREDAPRWARDEKWMLAKQLEAADDRTELLEYALRSIAEIPLGAEIPDRTTIWGLAKHMQETAKDALKGEA